MLRARTLKILAALLALCALACLPAIFELSFLGGHCGWGWCAPTLSGWIVTALLWLGIAWLLAWGLARVKFDRAKGARPGL